jgi:hypothetical protein
MPRVVCAAAVLLLHGRKIPEIDQGAQASCWAHEQLEKIRETACQQRGLGGLAAEPAASASRL